MCLYVLCTRMYSCGAKYIYVICRLGGPYGELKTVTEGLKMLPEAQFFTIRTDLSRQITCLFIFSCSKVVLQITNGFVYAALVIQWACAPFTKGNPKTRKPKSGLRNRNRKPESLIILMHPITFILFNLETTAKTSTR